MSDHEPNPSWELKSRRVVVLSSGKIDRGDGRPEAPEVQIFTTWVAKAMIQEEVEGDRPPDYTPQFMTQRDLRTKLGDA